jgi:threonine/homoserine/homoserine lactone efflux protein
MGAVLMLKADVALSGDQRLTRPGMWAGFIAGVLVILGNPKAILFYMGVLPGFFDLTEVGAWDVLAIVVVSIFTPLLGNLAVAGFVNHARDLLQTPEAVRRINRISGGLLIAVGIVIPFA